jgi:SAM-dependent methyltransferase
MSAHQEMNEFARWEARFATPDYAFGKEPNYFLKSCQQILPRHGQALAVADGEGRNGVWLAEQGLDVVSLDFSPAAQNKAWALAAERGVKVTFVRADVHVWDYPQTAFDVVVEIFAQFSPPARRAIKWRDMRRALKSGGVLIIQGYTPKQLEYGTGGPSKSRISTPERCWNRRSATFATCALSRKSVKCAKARPTRACRR